MSYLLENKATKERIWSKDLEGYPEKEFTVLASGRACKPREHCTFDEASGSWKLDKDEKAKVERRARLHTLERHELIDMIEEGFDSVEARLAALEARAAVLPPANKRKRIGEE